MESKTKNKKAQKERTKASQPILLTCSPWWWYIIDVTPSKRYPSNLYSSIHQRALETRKRRVSQLP